MGSVMMMMMMMMYVCVCVCVCVCSETITDNEIEWCFINCTYFIFKYIYLLYTHKHTVEIVRTYVYWTCCRI